ncbi:testis-expressed protein 36-like isoform 2-T2 [Odontesthes bonariensis]|uniref:testis-expressed protein 36 n=1 Tax=Odontesthes bonariensis TaxID=219752 RepID=UPI003F58AE9E
MVKGGKRYSLMSNDGKWFAHPVLPESETRSRETCTSTGIMLTQIKTSLPQALNFKRYPKCKSQQKSREYPLSCHDNKLALKDNMSVFSQGVGLRKCPDDRRQNNSHFCLCQVGAESSTEETKRNLTAYQSDFAAMTSINVPNRARRFPHNHKLRSAEAASAQAGEQFMWFGRDNLGSSETLEVLAATNCSATSKP